MLATARSFLQRIALTALAGIFVPLTAIGETNQALAMEQYAWKNRPLIVFAANSANADLRRQTGALKAHMSGLRERHMVVILVVGNSVRMLLGRGQGLSAAALRKRYDVAQGRFRCLLVGKDGGVKLSSPRVITTQRLFATIDAMPMRRREMRRRNS